VPSGVDGEVVLGGMTGAAGPAVARKGLVEEQHLALGHERVLVDEEGRDIEAP